MEDPQEDELMSRSTFLILIKILNENKDAT